MKTRLGLTDTMMDVVMKMSDGNPGAVVAIMEIMQKHEEIDPQAAMGGLGAIMILDTWEIYGTDIYILFNDKCGRDVRTMLMLMRATQLGFFSHSRLQEMAADQMREVNITEDELAELDKKVCDQLKDFKKAA
jgi:hypothetical protein